MFENDERPLAVTFEDAKIAIDPDRHMVLMRLAKPHGDLGFSPDLVFALQMAPNEARKLALQLVRKADEAEARFAQKQ